MGMDIDVLMCDWDVLTDVLVDFGCDDRAVIEKTLDLFGEKICDKYVILSTDIDGYDPVSDMCCAMDAIFDTDNCFSRVFDIEFDYISHCMPRNDERICELANEVKDHRGD